MNSVLEEIDGYYGILISKNNKIVYEKYKNNTKKTRFRLFSLSKPITALSIMLLIQMKKLKLKDTIDKFYINIPNNNKITILHLLQHTSGIYDFSSELYFKLNLIELFNKILDKNKTKFVCFDTCIKEINKNKPQFTPLKNPWSFKIEHYNNTGYDILGYIIYLVSGLRTNDFIKKYIFDKLKMKNSGFQIDENKNESIPYENPKQIGIKEQQNFYCGNAYITCTLRDYNIFLNNYTKLLNINTFKIYRKLYFFEVDSNGHKIMSHLGGGDFKYAHAKNNENYHKLSVSTMKRYIDKNINIITSENYRGEKQILNNENIFNKFKELYVNT